VDRIEQFQEKWGPVFRPELRKDKEPKKMEMLWYYDGDKPIYYTLKSDRAQERAELLLTMGKAMVEKIKL